MNTAGPAASGRDLKNRVDEAAQGGGVVRVPFRQNLDAGAPIVAAPLARDGGRQIHRYMPRFQFAPQRVERNTERLYKGDLGPPPRRPVGFGEIGDETGQPAGGLWPRPCAAAGQLGETIGRCAQRGDCLLVVRRRLLLFGIERRFDRPPRGLDEPNLLILAPRHEIAQGSDLTHLRQRRQALGERVRGIEIGRSDFDGVGTDLGLLLEPQECCDGIGAGAVEMQRIEIERQVAKQRCGAEHDQQRADDDRDAVADEELVERRQKSEAYRLRLARRLQHCEKRRQQRDADKKGDDHPRPGDLAELGEAAIGRRQERQEADCRGGGRQGERPPRPHGRAVQRMVEIRIFAALGAVAHAELNREVDTEADEKREIGYRDHIERLHHHKADRRRHRQIRRERSVPPPSTMRIDFKAASR